MQKIKTIRPTVFGDEVRSFFTLKNKSYRPEGAWIAGLNFGFNTNEEAGIISKNRKRLSGLIEVAPSEIAYASQIHSSNITFVSKGGVVEDCDALITRTPGLALAIQVADCAAVLIHEPQSGIIAAVHAGWRGAAADIVAKVLQAMQSNGAVLSSAEAYISPCISLEHFEVGREVADRFPSQFVDSLNYSKPHINLKSFLENQLINGGLSDEKIEVAAGCTMGNEDQFYSYRREKEQSGRMMGVIKVKA